MTSDCLYPAVSPQDDEDKLNWKDRFPGYLMNFASILFMVSSLRGHLPMIYACRSCCAKAVCVIFAFAMEMVQSRGTGFYLIMRSLLLLVIQKGEAVSLRQETRSGRGQWPSVAAERGSVVLALSTTV